jgi:hypothetical protein
MEPNDSGGSGGALSRHIAPNHAAARAPPRRLPQHEPVEGPGRADRAPGLPRRGPLRGSRCAALPPFAAHQRPPRRSGTGPPTLRCSRRRAASSTTSSSTARRRGRRCSTAPAPRRRPGRRRRRASPLRCSPMSTRRRSTSSSHAARGD